MPRHVLLVVPEVATPVTVTVWVSLRSASVKVTAPVAVSGVLEAGGSKPLSRLIVLAAWALVITGASSVPVTVIGDVLRYDAAGLAVVDLPPYK